MNNTKMIVDFNSTEVKQLSDEFWREFYVVDKKDPVLTDEEIAEDFSRTYEAWEYEVPQKYNSMDLSPNFEDHSDIGNGFE